MSFEGGVDEVLLAGPRGCGGHAHVGYGNWD